MKYDIPPHLHIYFLKRDAHAIGENQLAKLLVKSFSIISKPRMKLSTKLSILFTVLRVRSIYSTQMFI